MFIRRWECSFRGANHGYLFVSGTKKPLLRLRTCCAKCCWRSWEEQELALENGLTTQGDPRRGRKSPVAIQAQLQDLLLLGDTMGIIEASGDLSLLHCSAKIALSSSRISPLTTRPPCCNIFVFASWFQNCWGARVGETGVQAHCMAA